MNDYYSLCMCVCVFPGHQSVYSAQIIRWWGSNLRQWLILKLGSVHPPKYIFKPPYAEVCISKTRRTKYRQWVHFFISFQYSLIPTRYEYNRTRLMIQITYEYKGRTIGGTWYVVIRNSLPWWLSRGTCSPTNKHCPVAWESATACGNNTYFTLPNVSLDFESISSNRGPKYRLIPKYQVGPLAHAGIYYSFN